MPPWLIALRMLFLVGRSVRNSLKTEEQRQREAEEAVLKGIVFFVVAIALGIWLFTRSSTGEAGVPAISVAAQNTSYETPVVPPSYQPPHAAESVDAKTLTTENSVQNTPNEMSRQTVDEPKEALTTPPAVLNDQKQEDESQVLSQKVASEAHSPTQGQPDSDIANKGSSLSSAPATSAPKPQSRYRFHVSSAEEPVAFTDSEVEGSSRIPLRCLRNGQWLTGIGLFRIRDSVWIGTYDSLRIEGFYSYSAFQDKAVCQLFLVPGTFRIGNNRKLEFYRPTSTSLIHQACQSRFEVFADIAVGIADVCTFR